MQLSSLRSLPGSPFPTPLPSTPPPRRDVSAALPPQPPHHTPPQPRSHPSHPTAASLPNGCHSDRRGNPILWSSASPRLVSPTAALPKEPGDHGKDRVTTERQQAKASDGLGGSCGSTYLEGKGEQRQSWEAGSDKTGTHLIRSSYHPCSQHSSHLSTPSVHCSQPVLCSSAPRALFQGCARMYCGCTNSLQTKDLCYLPTAGTL